MGGSTSGTTGGTVFKSDLQEKSIMGAVSEGTDSGSLQSCLLRCSQVLASAEFDDRQSIESALRSVLGATRFDRVRIIENQAGTGNARYAQLTCAVSEDTGPSNQDTSLKFDYEHDCEGWNPALNEDDSDALVLPASLREKLKAENVHELLAFPLLSGKQWIGIITFEQLQENDGWREGETALLKAVAGMLGSHLGRRQAMTTLRRQLKLQSLLGEVAIRLAQTPSDSIGAEIDASLEAIGHACNVDRVSVFKTARERCLTTNVYEWCASGVEAQIARSQAFLLCTELPWLARELNSTQFVEINKESETHNSESAEGIWLHNRQTKTMAAIPLLIENSLYGFVTLESVRRAKVWKPELISALHVFGQLLAGTMRRSESDEAKLASEQRYRLIADNASDVIVNHDMDHHIVWASPSLQEIVGKDMTYLHGRSLVEFVHPEDADPLERLQKMTLRGANGDRATVRLHSHTGDWIWTEIVTKPIASQSGGAIDQYITVGRCVDQRKRVEDSLKNNHHFTQALFDAIPDPICFKDPDLRYRLVNKAFERFLGLDRRSIIGKRVEDIQRSDVAALSGDMDMSLLHKPGSQSYEVLLSRPDGGDATVLVHHTSLTNRFGKVLGIAGILKDISERFRTEKALKDLEARQKQILNAITDIIIVKSPESQITWGNTAFLEYYGMTEEDLIEFIDAHNETSITESYLEADRKVVESGKTLRVEEEPITRCDGEVRYFNTVKSPIFDISGKVSALVAVCRDVTNFRSTEKALEESNRLFMTLIGNLPGMVYRCKTDDQRTLLYVSNGCINLTGYTPSDLTNNRRVALSTLIHPEDLANVRRSLKRAIKERTVYQISYRIMAFDGSTRWVWEQGAVENLSNSNELCLEGLILDVTDRKVEEERRVRLATAVEQVAEAIMITNLDGVIEYVNPGFSQVTGYSFEEALGNEPAFLSKDLHEEEYFSRLWETVSSGEVWKGRLKNKHKSGRVIECDATISPVRDTTGKITNFVAVERDVTEMVNLEGQLRQAQKLEAVGSLAAGIAHEINTPIQFVGDNTHFLADAFKDFNSILETAQKFVTETKTHESCPAQCSQLREAVTNCDLEFYREEVPTAIDQTLQGVERVATIVRAMKDFSHPDTREKSAIEINKALKTTLTVARNELKYVADIETEFEEDLPILMGYPGELNQVFLNLLVNAAHAVAKVVEDGSSGKGKITVRTRSEPDYLVIEVEDTGCGIKAADRNRIFDPFYTTKPVGKGTGQGLAIARSVVVDKHEGTIDFRTEVGKGTTFIVRLPLNVTGEVQT